MKANKDSRKSSTLRTARRNVSARTSSDDGNVSARTTGRSRRRSALLQPPAHDGAHRRVGDVHGDQLAEVDEWCRRRGRDDGLDEPGRLLLSHGPERPDAPGAEQLHDADLAELPPVVAVRSHHDSRAVPGEDPGAQGHWPRREDGVVGLHELLCGVRRGCDDHRDLAELEEHERAVPERQVSQGAVNEGATEVVDAADDGELPWAWRKPKSMATRSKGNSPPELDKKVYEWKKSQQAVVVRTVVHDLGSLGLELLG